MHGRLKVKTSVEKEAEKQKKREVKKKLYQAGIKSVFTKRKENVHDSEGLKTGAQLLVANPDALTLWNIRRETLLDLKGEDETAWRNLLLEELNTTEHCLVQNPKSYGAWHHRDWLFKVAPSPPYEEEIALCDRYLQLDERNFHCWDHRRLIVNRSGCRTPEQEVTYTQQLIEKNLSNFSAWHYRSNLLPIVFPPEANSQLPISEESFIKELSRVVTAVFTDPADQSPWFFLRWLLSPRSQSPRILQIALLKIEEELNLGFVFDREISKPIDELRVRLNAQELSLTRLKQFRKDDKHIWLLPVESNGRMKFVVDHCPSKDGDATSSVTFEVDSSDHLTVFKDVSSDPFRKKFLSDRIREALKETVDNCQMLNEIDPGNKWVLLTLVNAMSTLDVVRYENDAIEYLTQLEKIDPLRINYYRDTRSKLLLESRLQKAFMNDSRTSIDLSNLGLTRLTHFHHLTSFEEVNLSSNRLHSIAPVASLLSCKTLILDGNPIKNLVPLTYLPNLTNLSLNSCNLKSMEILAGLKSKLKTLEIKGNFIGILESDGNSPSESDKLEKEIYKLIPGLEKLCL